MANADSEIVRLVEDLVTSYVEGNCLILVALPMSGKPSLCFSINTPSLTLALDDIENQKAARIAKEADPLGMRTIGMPSSLCYLPEDSP